jgi:hypothetical protein
MIPRFLLFQAKAFLCWDVFDDLAVQLVPLQTAAAFYFPPQNNLHSIVLFYSDECADYSRPLFLLFHEAGHIQYFRNTGGEEKYYKKLQSPNGNERMEFERFAWDEALVIFKQFLEKNNIEINELLVSFSLFAQSCIQSYAEPVEK